MQNNMVDEIINTDKENLLEDTTFIVDIDDKNTRIDKYLSDELADVSRSRIQKLLDEGMITAVSYTHLIRMDMVNRGEMMSIADVNDILQLNVIGAVPDDENIVVATNKGQPCLLYTSRESLQRIFLTSPITKDC